ncbi:MAG: amidase domain-containing protein [Clostridia bacterium]|nr:amidase domain-containing protein [Clostridia bacterium]
MPYDREAAVAYAREWAFKRNPAYLDFESLGGDCTNFASQVLHAGGLPMDRTPVYGWYYIDSYRRTASWTGVEYLYRHLLGLDTGRPRAAVTGLDAARPGDIVQLAFTGQRFQHSPVVVAVEGAPPQGILVAAHTADAYGRPLSTYPYSAVRPLHIL